MNNSAKAILMASGIMLLAVIFVGLGPYSISSTFGRPINVGLPVYASAVCQAGSTNEGAPYNDMTQVGQATPNGGLKKDFLCDFNTDACKLNVHLFDTSLATFVFKCNINADSGKEYTDARKTASCTEVWKNTLFSTTKGESLPFNYNSNYYIPTEKMVVYAYPLPLAKINNGGLSLQVSGQQYDLVSRTGQGYTTVKQNTCDVRQLHQSGVNSQGDVLQKDYSQALAQGVIKQNGKGVPVLLFSNSLNYVAGLASYVDDANIIQKNGIWVFVDRPGHYMPIENTPQDFGSVRYFADSNNGQYDSSIVCMPADPLCKKDGSGYLQSIANNTCTWYGGGTPSGWYPTEQTNKYCTYKCVNGNLAQDHCQTIKACNPGERYDLNKQDCVTITTGTTPPILPPGNPSQTPMWFWYVLIGIFVLLIIALMVWAMKK